jgi:3-hydroxy-D-aspartate aldolase
MNELDHNLENSSYQSSWSDGPADKMGLPYDTPTPAFVVIEQSVRHNLRSMIAAAGAASRFMPHLKTHRAPWLTEMIVSEGVLACKVATVAEAELALAGGMQTVLWAFPTVNPANIKRFIEVACKFPSANVVVLVDSSAAINVWRKSLTHTFLPNLSFRVDLDPGLGRTGATIGTEALDLARCLSHGMVFDGWHVYDGHIKHPDRADRLQAVQALAMRIEGLRDDLAAEGIKSDLVAGTSYTFELWPSQVASFVSSGSWAYSSSQHDRELAHLNWLPAGFVLATVISTRNGTATLDAGSKAIAPDKPVMERFRWSGKILAMNEEHTVVEAPALMTGDRVMLLPQHVCTSAYLYNEALVRTEDGNWEYRTQLGSIR